MHKEALLVNEEDVIDTISLDQDDPALHYTLIPNALIRDETISPECRWLIIYLISNKPGWTIKSRQLWQHTKGFMGRDAIKRILNEAIASGYMNREIVLRSAPKGRGKIRGYCYTISRTPKFKKTLRKTDFQAPDFQAPVGQATKEVLSQEILSKEELSPTSLKGDAPKAAKAAEREFPKDRRKKEAPEFSIEVRKLGTAMINALAQDKPDYSPPKAMKGMLTEIDYMLNKQMRDPEKLLAVFLRALRDKFWNKFMFGNNPAEYLRLKYDILDKRMNEPKATSRPHISIYEQVKKHFVHYETYNDAACYINEEGIAFQRGMKHEQLKFKVPGFWDQFDSMLKKFGIPNPLAYPKQEQT